MPTASSSTFRGGPHPAPGPPPRLPAQLRQGLAELAAARRAGLRFIGLARNTTIDRRLREAGCETTVPSLAPLLEAAHSL
ncbi:hypothetical protein ABTX62_24400 [Streptomyces sp. NPDC096046]|uniref:hypothetical protein n=1 Tax=Streptomyces sp. NPDC096046 TaxID=3155542 RepID=UPI00332D4282